MTAIGIMGGTFDPVHFGHLRAAEEVLQGFGLERVIFVPSGRPPHKPVEEVTPPEHRYLMTLLATADNPQFEVSRMEMDRVGPSYTLDSLKELRREYSPETAFYFITGLDAILEIVTWNGYRELFGLADFIAVTRPGYNVEALSDLEKTLGEERFAKIHPFPVTLLAIASRDIRRRVREGKSIRYLVPDPVVNYIRKERLYLTQPERRVTKTLERPIRQSSWGEGVKYLMKTLYIGNLPWSTTDEDLSKAFGQFVEVKSCRIITDRATGRSRGFGFVEVEDADAEKAVEAVNGTLLEGRQIIVNEARPRQPKY